MIFTQAAGLKNPTEGTKDYSVKVRTSATGDTTEVTSTTYNIPRELLLSTDNGNRGKTVTATGRGFQNGTTATVWLDTDEDGTRDTTETVLGNASVGSDDTFTLTFTVNVPPFVIGTTSNKIRAIDGQNNKDDGTVASYLVDGLMTVTPKEASIGDTVTVNIKDWPQDEDPTAVTQFQLGGVNIYSTLALLTAATSITSGEDTFTFVVPDGVTLGVQEIKLSTASENDTQNMTILGSPVEITPSTIAPNQTVTVQGRGFTENSSIDNSADTDSKITIGGVRVLDANIDEDALVSIDSSGNWVASVVIPVSSVTVEPGSYELKAFDASGREGVSTITIVDRDITLTPPESRAGTTLTVQGSGYPATNTTSPQDISITVKYSGSGFSTRTVTTNSDSSGNFSTTIGVPLGAGIPSTNTVTVEFNYTDPTSSTTFTVTDALTHRVPGASITIDPVSGVAGTEINVVGTGFKGTSQVSALTIATIDVRQVPVPSTDVDGNFTATFIVPQVDTGAQSVKATVAGTTASDSFTVTAAVAAATAAPASEEQDSSTVFAPIIDNNDNLVRVFRFNNATQGWAFYDPRPAFESANDLTTAAGGDIVWVRVNEAQDFSGISLVGGWNLIVLP
ncbi:MAG: hypothetical protein BZY80_07245 [SAR202 cluster bacterium Io17-Chloro-G2]|nr:MAG: hypothetical protein BZY80_07245 [SAR202 cluster bacterium Io17-Chloro-G2]